MAKIPDAMSLGGRPTPQPEYGLTPYNESLSAPGRALQRLGESVGDLAGDLNKKYKEEERRSNLIRAEDARNKIKEYRLGSTYGEKGYERTITGEKAATTPWINTNLTDFDSRANDIESSLDNDEQKQAFKQYLGSERYGYLADMTRHQVQQDAIYKKDVFNGVMNTAQATVATKWSDDNAILAETQRVEFAVRNAMPYSTPNEQNQAFKQSMSKIHEAVINQALANKDTERAKNYLNMVIKDGEKTRSIREEINPEKIKSLEEAINTKGLIFDAQREFEKKLGETQNEKELLDWARNSFEGPKQEEVRKNVYDWIQDKKADERVRSRGAEDAISNILMNGGKVSDIPHQLINDVGAAKYARIVETDRKKREAIASGKGVSTNLAHYAELTRMKDKEPDRLRELANNPSGPFPGYTIGATDAKSLIRQSNPKDISNSVIFRREVDEAAAAILEIKNVAAERKGKGGTAKRIWKFDKYIDDNVQGFIDTHDGRNPNLEELKAIISGAKVKVRTTGLFGDGEDDLYDISASFSEKYNMKPSEISRIWSAIISEKPDATEDDLERYLEKRSRGSR